MPHQPAGSAPAPTFYQIRLQGHLHQQWSEWFADMRIVLDTSGETLLIGPLADQAALYGVLRKIRDMGLPLIALMRIEDQPDAVSPAHQSSKSTDVGNSGINGISEQS